MAFSTLAALVADCDALVLASEKTHFPYRPTKINSVQLPMRFCRLPNVSRPLSSFTYAQGLKSGTIEIIILVQFVKLDTQEANDALTVTLTDELTVALEAAAQQLGMDAYTIVSGIDTIDNGTTVAQYILATVEVSG